MNDWHHQAACQGTPLDVFYPETNTSTNMYNQARAICATCPVLNECRDAAIREEGGTPNRTWLYGYRAGMTPRQRWKFLAPHLQACKRCGADTPRDHGRRYCAACRPIVRAETLTASDRRRRAA